MDYFNVSHALGPESLLYIKYTTLIFHSGWSTQNAMYTILILCSTYIRVILRHTTRHI